MTTFQSLFAEGSYSETKLKVHLKKATKIISIIIFPAIIVTYLFGYFILLAFGKEYSDEGFILLSLITTAVIILLSVILIKMNLFGVVGV
jgi:O-antigen/teichoic acid export membrane protein